MDEGNGIHELQALDAVAAEHGAALAFRICEDGEGFEPVFMRVHRANAETEDERALISFADRDGLPLGRYVVPSARLDALLAEGEPIADDEHQPV